MAKKLSSSDAADHGGGTCNEKIVRFPHPKERKKFMDTMEPINGRDFEIQILRDQRAEDQAQLAEALKRLKGAAQEMKRLNNIIALLKKELADTKKENGENYIDLFDSWVERNG